MTPAQLKQAMLDDLARSGLTAEDAKIMQLKPEAKTTRPKDYAGYIIPYIDPNTKKQRTFTDPETKKEQKYYRKRFLEDTRSAFDMQLAKSKPQRYGQPQGSEPQIYFPPNVNWKTVLANKDTPIVITEGEKKAYTACKHSVVTVAVGGTGSFQSTRKGIYLLPGLEMISDGRELIICYDSDAASNPDIIRSELSLAHKLTEAGARVRIARIPQINGHKVGIDDFIKERGVAKFAADVLANAVEGQESLQLHKFNEELILVRQPCCIYIREDKRIISEKDYNILYANRMIVVQVDNPKPHMKSVPAAKRWLAYANRSEAPGITYSPGQPEFTEAGHINDWPGWGVEAEYVKKGDVSLFKKLLDHLLQHASAEERVWVLQWLAYPLQHPGKKLATALLVAGNSGTGKSLLGLIMVALYGKNGATLTGADIDDDRNTWLQRRQFIQIDDLAQKESYNASSRYKTLVTLDTVRINPKYIEGYDITVHANLYLNSNDAAPVTLDSDDRRYFVLDIRTPRLPAEIYKPIDTIMRSKGAERSRWLGALMHFMLSVDTSKFDPQAPAMETVARREMIHYGKSELGAIAEELVSTPLIPGCDLYTAGELLLRHPRFMGTAFTITGLGRHLSRYRLSRGQVNIAGKRHRIYALFNTEIWNAASNKAIEDHYLKYHPPMHEHKTAKEKF